MTSLVPKIFRIQYVSDMHLEFYEKLAFSHIVKPNARFLALAGDIGQPNRQVFKSFLNWAHDKWDHIFYVPGNHEYYNHKPYVQWKKERKNVRTMDQLENEIQEQCAQYSNVHFLQMNSIHLPDFNVAVCGATLWSDIPVHEEDEISDSISDYSRIAVRDSSEPDGYRRFRVDDSRILHGMHREWLRRELLRWKRENTNVVVISHHLPSYELIAAKYKDSAINGAFASNMDTLLDDPVRVWICGHTHTAKTVVMPTGTVATTNPRGYPNEVPLGFTTGTYHEFKVEGPPHGNGGTVVPKTLCVYEAEEPKVLFSSAAAAAADEEEVLFL